MSFLINEKELEVPTEAADAVYQRSEYRYNDVKKEGTIVRKYIDDKNSDDSPNENIDYIKLYNSNDEIKNDKYYKPNPVTGFKYAVYQKKNNKNEIILAYAGTDRKGYYVSARDVHTDIKMGINLKFGQMSEALEAYNSVRSNHKTAKITITGHSLGGSMAQFVGAITGEKAVTFNAYGIKRLHKKYFEGYEINLNEHYDNIINYKLKNDLLYKWFERGISNNNLGTTYIVDGGPDGPVEAHEMIYYILNNPKILAKDWEKDHKIKSGTEWDYAGDVIDRETDVPRKNISPVNYKDSINPIWNKTIDEIMPGVKSKKYNLNFLYNLKSNKTLDTISSIEKNKRERLKR